jgi:hypothetical protein
VALAPPMPTADSYLASQDLAEQLLNTASLGVMYPTVRYRGGDMRRMFSTSAPDGRAQGTDLQVHLER